MPVDSHAPIADTCTHYLAALGTTVAPLPIYIPEYLVDYMCNIETVALLPIYIPEYLVKIYL